MAGYGSFEPHRIKHLEMIQVVISRLGNDGFLVKGWAVTVSGVFLGVAVSSKQPELAAASLLPTVFFWCLDTYFLRAERLFRTLYDRVRTDQSDIEPFAMGATAPWFIASLRGSRDKDVPCWWKTFWRPALWLLYLGLMVSAGVVAVATCGG